MTSRAAARVMVLVAFAALEATCGRPAGRTEPAAIVVGVRNAPNNLDPRVANDEASTRAAQLIFTPLMDLGDDLRPVPKLAARLDHPDPLTYIAYLRHGVRFHDGHELTARDVVHTYRSVVAPESRSPYKGAFQVVADIAADDAYTVQIGRAHV